MCPHQLLPVALVVVLDELRGGVERTLGSVSEEPRRALTVLKSVERDREGMCLRLAYAAPGGSTRPRISAKEKERAGVFEARAPDLFQERYPLIPDVKDRRTWGQEWGCERERSAARVLQDTEIGVGVLI